MLFIPPKRFLLGAYRSAHGTSLFLLLKALTEAHTELRFFVFLFLKGTKVVFGITINIKYITILY